MERLTERTVAGTANLSYPSGCYYADGEKDQIAVSAYRQKAIDRLADYEEFMERWRLRSLEEAGRIFQRVNALGGTDLMAQYRDLGPIDHLRELAQAEKDGRLVVLPECVPGDPPPKKREMRTEGATSYCPKNCPNKDCVGGQCLVNHGTKPRQR